MSSGYFPIYHPPEIIRAIVAASAIMGPRRKMCINPGKGIRRAMATLTALIALTLTLTLIFLGGDK